MNTTPPWSRRVSTQPFRVTVLPACSRRSSPHVCVLFQLTRAERYQLAPARGRSSRMSALESGRKPRDGRPELLERTDRTEEVLDLDRLGHVGVGVELVGAEDVVVGLGAREDDHRDAF